MMSFFPGGGSNSSITEWNAAGLRRLAKVSRATCRAPRYACWVDNKLIVGVGSVGLPPYVDLAETNIPNSLAKYAKTHLTPNDLMYQAFFPLQAVNDGFLFGRLNLSDTELKQRTVQHNGYYILNRRTIDSWSTLERNLLDAASYLIQCCNPRVPTITPPKLPSSARYAQAHQSISEVLDCAKEARNLFLMLSAYLTFALTLWIDEDLGDSQSPFESAFDALRKRDPHPIPQQWVECLQGSYVCELLPGFRPGAYLWALDTLWSPWISRFLLAKVPIWIHWGNLSSLNFKPNDNRLEWFRPPSEVIEGVEKKSKLDRQPPSSAAIAAHPWSTAIVACPSSLSFDVDFSANDDTESIGYEVEVSHNPLNPPAPTEPPQLETESGQRQGEGPLEFIARMESAAKLKASRETPTEKQSRLSHEEDARKGFTKGTKYFKWEQESEGWVRRRVEASLAVQTFEVYAPSQRKYLSHCHQWDLCVLYDPHANPVEVAGMGKDMDEDEESEDEGQPASVSVNSMTVNTEFDHPTNQDSALAQTAPAQAASSGWLSGLRVEATAWMYSPKVRSIKLSLDTPEQFLKSRYGFTASQNQAAPNPEPQGPVKTPRRALDILGNKRLSPGPNSLSYMEWANILHGTVPPSTLPAAWDISPIAVDRLSMVSDKLRLWQVETGYFIGIKCTTPEDQSWLLFVKEAMTVAQIYRQSGGIRKTARFLLSCGIPFNTARYRSLQKAPTAHVVPGLGYRRAGYTPGAHDYVAYVECRDKLLKGSAGQAALKMGGIVWRLAIEVVSTKSVLDGPALSADWYGQVLSEAEGGGMYIDDDLDESEISLICGVYRIETSVGADQHSSSSWWPRQDTWMRSGACHGHWTVDNERWFQDRLERIRTGNATLICNTKWRKALEGQRLLRRIYDNTEAHCKAWVSKQIMHGYHP
ncbi:hypothetical protein BD779DRAFT_238843 [Infundibulicybe gibba]|nr:hypothetical protein BD779DRAFT_238843 [Infundibulicybe gibba]